MAAPVRKVEGPRKVMAGLSVGSPLLVIFSPGTFPCSISMGDDWTPRFMSFASTAVAAPVKSLFFIIP